MTRFAAAALLGLALTAAATTAAPGPPSGKSVEVQFHQRLPRFQQWWCFDYDYQVTQGDQIQVEVSSVNGVKLNFQVEVYTANGKNPMMFDRINNQPSNINWKCAKLPQGAVILRIGCNDAGLANVRVTRIDANGNPVLAPGVAPGAGAAPPGAAPPAPAPNDELRLLRAEVELLKAQTALLRRELDDLRQKVDPKK